MNKFCLFLFSTIVKHIISQQPMFVTDCNNKIIQEHSKHGHTYCEHACSNFPNISTPKEHVECTTDGYCLCRCSDKVTVPRYNPVLCSSSSSQVEAMISAFVSCRKMCSTLCTGGDGRVCSESDTSLVGGGIYVEICTCSCPQNDCSSNFTTTTTTLAPTTMSTTISTILTTTTTTPRPTSTSTSTPVPEPMTVATTPIPSTTPTTPIPSTTPTTPIPSTPTTSTTITTTTSRPVTTITPFQILYSVISSYVGYQFENNAAILWAAVSLKIIILKLIAIMFYEFIIFTNLNIFVLGLSNLFNSLSI